MLSFKAANHPLDIILFNFKKAFDKMPHDRVSNRKAVKKLAEQPHFGFQISSQVVPSKLNLARSYQQ